MVVSDLVKGLDWQESVVYWCNGQPDNVGQTFFLLILLSLAHPRHPPILHTFVSTHDTTSLVQLLRFSILFGGKLYKKLRVLEVV